MRTRRTGLSLLVWLTGLVASCGGGQDTPTAPTPLMTETFSGELLQLGLSSHGFVVQKEGDVTVTILAMSPQSTITVGVGIGTSPDGFTCTLVAVNNSMRLGGSATGRFAPSVYCVAIFDVGNLLTQDPLAYTLQVVHP